MGKGKPATKGQKQIVDDNKSTIMFYAGLALGAEVCYMSAMLILFYQEYTAPLMLLTFVSITVYAGALQFMHFMARATYSETGQLLDGGIDLNMESGVAEHLKDMIILTCAVQGLSLISDYFWALWLLAPVRAGYVFWVTILAPWFFQPAVELDEKKQKKMERRMKRQH